MQNVIIIDDGKNNSLLRFTETKLFFDAKNKSRSFIDDCYVVESREDALTLASSLSAKTIFIIRSGYFLTSSFVLNYADAEGVIEITEDNPYIIVYDPDSYIGFNKRCKYPPMSKHLYIVENMLKSILAAGKNIYIENTEEPTTKVDLTGVKHLYGLAAGWKTLHLANQIGFENLQSITVYDINQYQLDYAKKLYSNSQLPDSIDEFYYNRVGEYAVTEELKLGWQQWAKYPIKFQVLDLFTTPIFPPNSAVWISNVFKFEPNIFKYGWKKCKEAEQRLIDFNKESIIFKK